MKRNYHIDCLRAAATYGVILWHCFSPVYYQFGPVREWAAANIMFGFAIRWSVAVFVMISGALLLDREEPVMSFYRKRLVRICIPLLTWTMVYGLSRLYYFKVYTYDHHPKPGFWVFMYGQYKDLLNDRLSYHLYFVSIILGLYIITPFVARMMRGLGEKEMRMFVMIGAGVYSLRFFFPNGLILDHFELGSYFVYFILGHYLYKYPPKGNPRLLIYAGSVVAAILMTWLNYRTEYTMKGHRDTVYRTDGPFVYMLSIAIFVLFGHLIGEAKKGLPGAKPGFLKRSMRRLVLAVSNNSYGIYIAHPLLISYLIYGTFESFSFSTARATFVLFGYEVNLTMNNAWGAVVQSMLMMAILLLFFCLVRLLRLQRYFT